MNRQQIESWLDSALDIYEELITSGEELSEEEELALFETIQFLFSELVRLDQEQPAPAPAPSTPPAQQPLPSAEYPSAQINAFRYDPKTQRLLVKFHGRDSAESGPTYAYEGVPENIFDTFRRGAIAPRTTGKNRYHAWFRGVTPSLGASMNQLIKNGGYPYSRVA